MICTRQSLGEKRQESLPRRSVAGRRTSTEQPETYPVAGHRAPFGVMPIFYWSGLALVLLGWLRRLFDLG